MQKLLGSLMVVGICLTPLTMSMFAQNSWAQAENSQSQQLRQLIEQAQQQEHQNKHEQAILTWQQVLTLAQQLKDRKIQAQALLEIGSNQDDIGKRQQALESYNQALSIYKEVGSRSGEANTLNNIGIVYSDIGQPQKALEFYQQALPILKEVGDRSGEANTLSNIGIVYSDIGQPQKALEFYQQALPILKEVGSRSGEAKILNNMAFVYRDTNHPTEAINNWQQAVKITLQIRRELQQSDRQDFLKDNEGSQIALVDFLIDQKQPEKAYEWVNLYTTTDLADYSRLINAKVANPDAQQQLEQWNQQNRQLESWRQDLSKKFTVELSQRINDFQAEINKSAENISRKFPEVAELFETTTTDIAQLRANIPDGTVIVQPVLLENSIAIFVLTKTQVKVIKRAINPKELDTLITQYSKKVQMAATEDWSDDSLKLYDILIRPVSGEIEAAAPKQLSIIATGKFRYIPFESLYDSKTKKFLIEKYPVNNLTRISSRNLQDSLTNLQVPRQAVLALSNPFPNDERNLKGAEKEVKAIQQVLPSSEIYLNNKATLDTFKTQAQRFNFLHIATHGCFISEGCKSLKMDKNTILFADKNLDMADAALLGLKNVSLITLSACRTAITEESNGAEIAGIAYLFERAGAKSVIASLWSVNDDSTRQLMVKFYENLKQGMSKGEALRQAKLSLINNQVYSHPYYWSPFILIGDAR